MNGNAPTLDKRDEKNEKLRPVAETALVQCHGFRCLAYRDKEGKWRSFHRPEEVLGVIKVLD
jgi:hypothetical protein